jgi:hypothetical protein
MVGETPAEDEGDLVGDEGAEERGECDRRKAHQALMGEEAAGDHHRLALDQGGDEDRRGPVGGDQGLQMMHRIGAVLVPVGRSRSRIFSPDSTPWNEAAAASLAVLRAARRQAADSARKTAHCAAQKSYLNSWKRGEIRPGQCYI